MCIIAYNRDFGYLCTFPFVSVYLCSFPHQLVIKKPLVKSQHCDVFLASHQ